MQTATKTNAPIAMMGASKERELPIEIVLGAAKYAEMVRGTEHMIPSSQVMDVIAKQRGWK